MRTGSLSPNAAREQRRPRSPGVVYGGLTVGLVVLLAAVALTTRQPPPPSIAEFAPQAVEQIREAPTEQSSAFGSGEGGSGLAAGETARPTAAPRTQDVVIDTPRVRRCVGEPPRQIEDPQSPPCVPYWAGDNGGSTWQGVTGTEVKIYVPAHRNKQATLWPALAKFFNRRFEFYGRKITFVMGQSNNGSNLQADQHAAAADADETHKVFASLMYRTAQGFYFHDDLARRKVPSVVAGIFGAYERPYLAERRPYLWSYTMEADAMFAELGRWACARLVGGKARFAGDVTMTGKPRRFGVIMQTSYTADKTSPAPLERALDACGASRSPTLDNPIEVTGGEDNQPTGADPVSANNAVLQLSNDGVTSVFCLCQPYAAGNFMKAASNQKYAPEWLLSSYGNLDTITALTALAAAPPDQLAHAFGLTFYPRQVRPEQEPVNWAVKEADAAQNPARSATNVLLDATDYRPLLLLAAGIQMAGPRLTPETFERGLQRAAFPNPPHVNLPGAVSLRPSRHAMTADAAEWWWSPTARSPYFPPDQGTPCYVDAGQRRTGTWPRGDAAFFGEICDSGA